MSSRGSAVDSRDQPLAIEDRSQLIGPGLIAAGRGSLHGDLDRSLGRERHRILVKRLGWIRQRLLEEGVHTAEARRAGARS